MAKKRIIRDRRPRLRLVVGILTLLSIAMAVIMVTTAFRMRDDLTESIDFDQLRLDMQADSARASEILRPEPRDTSARIALDGMPPGGHRLPVDRTIRLGREFADLNPIHIATARRMGISPLMSDDDAWFPTRPIIKVETCQNYYIDRLTHSLPYLVPEAANLLNDIGIAFRDSLAARGGGAYRIKATSLLRTDATIRRLRRRNVNATTNSAHRYGTTFDISYSNFICDSDTLPRTAEDLKLLLAEVLRDMRSKGRCWVKHERKQACFHITVRQ